MVDKNIKYTKQITNELWSDESASKFYYRFKSGNLDIDGNLDYSDKLKWDKNMKISVAKATLGKEKAKRKQMIVRGELKLSIFVKKNFACDEISDFIVLRYYEKHIKPYLGEMQIDKIQSKDIEHMIKSQIDKEFNLSTFKIVTEFLIKIFELAVDKKIISYNPTREIEFHYIEEKEYIKVLQDKLSEIYNVVTIVFSKDPLITSFFLFLFNGKSAKQLNNLKWELIDFETNSYRFKKEKMKRNYLHPAIKDELLKVRKEYGPVYQSDIELDGEIQSSISEKSYKINQYIPDFSIKSLENLVEELRERKSFEEEVREYREQKMKQKALPQKKIIKPKMSIGKVKKKT